MDEGRAKSGTTTTMKEDIFAFIFGQKGLMADLGFKGTRPPRSIRSSLRPQRRAEVDLQGLAREQERRRQMRSGPLWII